jgi:hypothetical protein
MSNGTTKLFHGCSLETECEPGHVCIDLGGNAQYFCKPLCRADADCEPYGLRCSSALCGSGRKPGVRVCVEQDSVLSPAYDATACCSAAVASTSASASGCADGTREAFTDPAQYPEIAGCEAKWPLASMRAPPTGRACGNSLGVECSVPADACGVGWHVCGTPPYGPADINAKVSADQCASQPGKYAAALGDRACEICEDQLYGAGAVCCGTSCLQGSANCVFPQATAWFGSVNNRWGYCAGLVAAHPNQGVLCCRGS